MKRHLISLLVLFLTGTSAFSQTIEELYAQRDYKKLIEYSTSESLTKEQCYCIGYAYFQLEDDANAIKMYDLAISKGLDEDYIYLYKGLSLSYDKQYSKAIDNFKIAIERNPKGQKNYTELANVFYLTERYDSALVYFYKARELEFELGDPYFKIPNIYHIQENFDKALEEYQISASLIDKSDPLYAELLQNIGLLEYSYKKNYPNSIQAYSDMLIIIPQEYNLYCKLIKAYYANEEYSKGDSVFNILKTKYEHKELPKEMMEIRGEVVDEFTWNGQRVSAMKYYEKPKKFAEPIFQFFLIDKKGEAVEKKILTEKTMSEIDGTKHLLCGIDKKTGFHHTYPIGWETDEIDYKELKKYVIMVLDGEIQPQASSNFGANNKKKK